MKNVFCKLTFTAAVHTIFPLDYCSKTEVRPEMLLCVGAGKKNPYVNKHVSKSGLNINANNVKPPTQPQLN